MAQRDVIRILKENCGKRTNTDREHAPQKVLAFQNSVEAQVAWEDSLSHYNYIEGKYIIGQIKSNIKGSTNYCSN